MKIAVLGAGFTGLSATLRLLQQGHEITLIEKEANAGGLAGGFKRPNWEWTLEKSYHHIFTSDTSALSLAQELGIEIIKKKPRTDTYIKEQILPLDTPSSLLAFPHLSPIDKLRTGAAIAYLKLLRKHQKLEGIKALPWIRKFMGKNAMDIIWEPLFNGKFSDFKDEVALTWFWGRIKKRTPTLCYPEGGFQEFANKIAEKIISLGGEILLNHEVKLLKSTNHHIKISLKPQGFDREFDTVISTLPTPTFTKIAPQLTQSYKQKVLSIPHLNAQVLILTFKKPFLKNSYWLNINDSSFPFLVLAEHTNFMDSQYYGGDHILYIGNYLPDDHPYLKMSAKELFMLFKPFLQKINPTFNFELCTFNLFTQPFAQPVVDINYLQKIPQFKTPLQNVYLANMDMVYPWDRETNYAIEMGEKIAELINNEF